MTNPNDLPVRCPRCQKPKILLHAQEKPAKPYARCVACGWTGGVMEVLPPLPPPPRKEDLS
mgnify:CR=1 FL=1